MDELRHLIVQLEFVNSNIDKDEVIARSITYAGFVGILTGVRYVPRIKFHFSHHEAINSLMILVVEKECLFLSISAQAAHVPRLDFEYISCWCYSAGSLPLPQYCGRRCFHPQSTYLAILKTYQRQ